MAAITKAQRDALKWLSEHNGDGVFERTGVLLAAGERAPVRRCTWNALADAGLVQFYRITDKGRPRLRITAAAAAAA